MKTRILIAALAAALALPAVAADEAKEPKRFAFDFDFNFDFDIDRLKHDLLADAGKSAEFGRAYAERMRDWAHDFAEHMQGSMTYMFADRVGRGRVVKGAPYSAEVLTETNQKLADGNLITHQKMSRVYRDGEGRTRQETYRDNAVRSIYITDPVAGANYTLIPGRKLAVTTPRMEHRLELHFGPRGERERTSEREGGRADVARKVVVRTLEGTDGAPGTREEVRVQVIRMGDGTMRDIVVPVPPVPPKPPTGATAPVPPVPPLPPIPMPGLDTMRFESTAHLGKGTTTNLGTKDFDGVKAEGKSVVWTIPAGKIGNRNPINVTSEKWYSPDLQVTVYSRHSDPRTGESIYRLASIKRAEPQADLFKVPEGYETKGRGKRAKPEKPDKPEKR
jgi:hypothetical protein